MSWLVLYEMKELQLNGSQEGPLNVGKYWIAMELKTIVFFMLFHIVEEVICEFWCSFMLFS